jgi:hypothetical protein
VVAWLQERYRMAEASGQGKRLIFETRRRETLMIRKSFLVPAMVLAFSGQLLAGSVLEMSARYQAGPAALMDRMYAQDGKLRMDHMDGKGGILTSMIFRNNEMLVISHPDKKFNRINEEMLAKFSDQMKQANDAMKKMQQQMANLPPQQRAMMEKIMKGKMPGMPPKAQLPTLRVEATGQGRWESYSCKNYTIHFDEQRREEVCAAPPSEVKGSDEVLEALRNMREFQKKMTEALPQIPMGGALNQQIEAMNQIDGFAVHRQEYNKDVKQNEIFLSSAREESLSDDIFSPPQGYKEEKMMPGAGGSK